MATTTANQQAAPASPGPLKRIILIVLIAISALSIGITLLVALLGGAFVATVQTRAVHGYLEKYRSRTASNPANR